MYWTFWTPLGHIDQHTKNLVTVTYFNGNIGQIPFSMHWPVNENMLPGEPPGPNGPIFQVSIVWCHVRLHAYGNHFGVLGD